MLDEVCLLIVRWSVEYSNRPCLEDQRRCEVLHHNVHKTSPSTPPPSTPPPLPALPPPPLLPLLPPPLSWFLHPLSVFLSFFKQEHFTGIRLLSNAHSVWLLALF